MFMLIRKACIEAVYFQTTFLSVDVNEDIYIKLPKDYDKSGQIYKLGKILYGLEQIPRNCFRKLQSSLIGLGFREFKAADCFE